MDFNLEDLTDEVDCLFEVKTSTEIEWKYKQNKKIKEDNFI